MALTPLDIHNKQFPRSFRGYNETEVDEFLEQVGREFDQVLRDNAALREQVEALNARLEQYRQLEDTLHNTLVVAQETAEEVKASAQKQAELMINQARLEAEQIVQAARAKAEEMERRYQELLSSMKAARARMRALLLAHLQLLDEEAGDGSTDEGAAGERGDGEEAQEHRGDAKDGAGRGVPAGTRDPAPLGAPAAWGAREAAAARDRAGGV
ncbi:DivIVA domain-containing protein [Thermaerobacter sp. PB12/4term]|uniref:DivIVA domain-containing protein n=1 Tax=Thermaerobacter sp. PB12/4term TaxID=2293838 RepID=UPI000E32565A|nr:DivIVA domain-containing protein [Thermaerobacter sp. PB12/4term]QIA26857.1 DivIVA domain-containing protein [Thermaerobacter sp. PB12/4term]